MTLRDRIDVMRAARQAALISEPLDRCAAGAAGKGSGSGKVLKERPIKKPCSTRKSKAQH